MSTLVTRFHLLLLWVTLALTAVAVIRIPADFGYPAHWGRTGADWLWPRDLALAGAPLTQLILLATFFVLGRSLPKAALLQSQHVLDPALTLLMGTVAAVQLGLLLIGIGSDIDLIRLTAAALGIVLAVLGLVLFGAERHTYGSLRLPWPVRAEAWNTVHRTAGIACALGGAGLLLLAWQDPGIALLILALPAALLLPAVLSAVTTLLSR